MVREIIEQLPNSILVERYNNRGEWIIRYNKSILTNIVRKHIYK